MANHEDSFEGDDRPYEAESASRQAAVFDAGLLQEPLTALPSKKPLVFSPSHPVSEAMQGMQKVRRGCVVVTEDGTSDTRLIGIFTERDVLRRVVGGGRNPVNLPLGDVMTPQLEVLPAEATIAWVLNKMALGGFRHVPVVDEKGLVVTVVSVRDVVQFLVELFPRDVLNMPPEFGADRVSTREGA